MALDPAIFEAWDLPDDGDVVRFTTRTGVTGTGPAYVWLALDTPCLNVDVGADRPVHVFPEFGDTWVRVR